MKKWRVEYNQEREYSPISWWVHKSVSDDTSEWRHAATYEPPFPNKVVLKGYPYLIVSIGSFNFEFASSYELQHAIDLLSQKNLPSTKNMVNEICTTYTGHNHWLSSYPSNIKSWKSRQKTVALLSLVLRELLSTDSNF